ncbi:MAG TPA: ferric reductase-like transmembrane domain-containing protein [Xanthobacteraceae bacterium]
MANSRVRGARVWIVVSACDSLLARKATLHGAPALKLAWPWQDRQRRFSALKAAAFAFMLAPGAWLAYQLGSGDFGIYPMWLGGLTYWSGVWATAVLLLALAVTPALTILGWRSLIDVRRMIGVAALAYTIAHVVIYFALRFWNFATIVKEMATSPSLIAATLSTVGLLALGLTSVDAAIARMGARGWQRLHNTIYVVSALALLHALLSRGTNPMQYLLTGMFFWLMIWRVLDRYGRGTDPKALAMLAISSCLFAALLEAALVWVKRGYSPVETLGYNFSLIFGIPPVWEILALGLLIALAAAAAALRLPSPRVTT